MLRLIHSFDIRPGVHEQSFIEWLDSELWQRSREFGCLERKTWVFLDGFEGSYEQPRPVKRPKYLNEAFWPHQEAAERFRRWLISDEAREFRRRWFDGVSNHTVLRYVEFKPETVMGDD